MLHEHIEFFKGTMIEQQVNALAGCQFAPLMLCVDALLSATQAGLGPPLFQLFQNVFHDASVPAIQFPFNMEMSLLELRLMGNRPLENVAGLEEHRHCEAAKPCKQSMGLNWIASLRSQ